MISKKLQDSGLIYFNVNLMTDVFKIVLKYRRKIIAKYRQILLFIAQWEPSLNELSLVSLNIGRQRKREKHISAKIKYIHQYYYT